MSKPEIKKANRRSGEALCSATTDTANVYFHERGMPPGNLVVKHRCRLNGGHKGWHKCRVHVHGELCPAVWPNSAGERPLPAKGNGEQEET